DRLGRHGDNLARGEQRKRPVQGSISRENVSHRNSFPSPPARAQALELEPPGLQARRRGTMWRLTRSAPRQHAANPGGADAGTGEIPAFYRPDDRGGSGARADGGRPPDQDRPLGGGVAGTASAFRP